jgi:hypothetical protein
VSGADAFGSHSVLLRLSFDPERDRGERGELGDKVDEVVGDSREAGAGFTGSAWPGTGDARHARLGLADVQVHLRFPFVGWFPPNRGGGEAVLRGGEARLPANAESAQSTFPMRASAGPMIATNRSIRTFLPAELHPASHGSTR